MEVGGALRLRLEAKMGLKIVLLKAQAAKFRLTTPKAFTLTLGIFFY